VGPPSHKTLTTFTHSRNVRFITKQNNDLI
jgi:hypothetical protein